MFMVALVGKSWTEFRIGIDICIAVLTVFHENLDAKLDLRRFTQYTNDFGK